MKKIRCDDYPTVPRVLWGFLPITRTGTKAQTLANLEKYCRSLDKIHLDLLCDYTNHHLRKDGRTWWITRESIRMALKLQKTLDVLTFPTILRYRNSKDQLRNGAVSFGLPILEEPLFGRCGGVIKDYRTVNCWGQMKYCLLAKNTLTWVDDNIHVFSYAPVGRG